MEVNQVRAPKIIVKQPVGPGSFENFSGDIDFRGLAFNELRERSFEGQPVFSVVSPDSIPSNISPKNFSQNHNALQKHGIKTMVYGKLKSSKKRKETTEEVELCLKEDKEDNDVEELFGSDCAEYETFDAPKYTNIFKVHLHYKVDVLSGKGVEYADRISVKEKDSVVRKDEVDVDEKGTGDDEIANVVRWISRQESAKSFEKLRQEAYPHLARKLVGKLSPVKQTESVELLWSNQSGENKKLINKAVEFAEDDEIDKACGKLHQVYKRGIRSSALLYNYGVCYEYERNYPRAKTLYKQAKKKATSDQKTVVEKAIKRIEKALKHRRKIERNFPLDLRKNYNRKNKYNWLQSKTEFNNKKLRGGNSQPGNWEQAHEILMTHPETKEIRSKYKNEDVTLGYKREKKRRNFISSGCLNHIRLITSRLDDFAL
ncbi:MAG: hypothetical protein ABEJ65_02895 [bacterium]